MTRDMVELFIGWFLRQVRVAMRGGSVTPALLAVTLLLVACGDPARQVVVRASPTSTPAPAATATAAVTATSEPTLAPATMTPTAIPPTATSTPDATTTAQGVATAAAIATANTRQSVAIQHLGAGNTLRRAGNVRGALSEYATAQALAPAQRGVASAVASARAMATATARAIPTPTPVQPLRLQIPKIGVNASVESVGVTDGAMDTPQSWWDVGWLRYGPVPGSVGNSVIDGHLDSLIGPAVFWRLDALDVGDTLDVVLSNGSTTTFDVVNKASYPYNSAPLQQIFGAASTANLNLITCGGSWNFFQRNYSNRIVIYTRKA